MHSAVSTEKELTSDNRGSILNLKSFAVRSLIAVIFGPLIILLALQGGLLWVLFILIVVLLSNYEYYHLAEKKEILPKYFIGAIFSTAIVYSFYFAGEFAVVPLLLLAFVVCLLYELYGKKNSPTLNAAVTLFGSFFFSLLFGSFVLIRELPGRWGLSDVPAGRWLVLIILATWICDTAAYIFGSYFGRHKLIPRISPNKTVEGTAAGFIFAVITAYVCHITFIVGLGLKDSLVMGAIVGSFGQYGDLIESMIKRDAGVKDSSNLIPGHGGVLDRFDSLTFSAPVIYIYLRLFIFY